MAEGQKNPVGRPKKIESPQKLWEHFVAYRNEIKGNPLLVHDFVGKFSDEVYRKKDRPLTLDGFENYCADQEIIEDLGDYFSNKDSRYIDFATICSRIKRVIRQDQIEGGMAGIYNPSVTQRLNGLVDKREEEIDIKTSDPDLLASIAKRMNG